MAVSDHAATQASLRFGIVAFVLGFVPAFWDWIMCVSSVFIHFFFLARRKTAWDVSLTSLAISTKEASHVHPGLWGGPWEDHRGAWSIDANLIFRARSWFHEWTSTFLINKTIWKNKKLWMKFLSSINVFCLRSYSSQSNLYADILTLNSS